MVLNTEGAFSYAELMAMELGEYIDLIKEIGEINRLDRKAEKAEKEKVEKMSMEQQMAMAESDPAIPNKRL